MCPGLQPTMSGSASQLSPSKTTLGLSTSTTALLLARSLAINRHLQGTTRLSGSGKFLAAENRILSGQIKGRLLLSDGEKVTLAEIAHCLRRMALEDVATIAKPDTILGWYRKLIANKFDGPKWRRSIGRPKVDQEAERSFWFSAIADAP